MNNIFTRFWNFVVNGKSIISKSCCPNISVGDELVDKDWGDTFIKIVAINKDRTEVRYIFLKIEGNPIIESSKYSTRIDFLKSKYKLIK